LAGKAGTGLAKEAGKFYHETGPSLGQRMIESMVGAGKAAQYYAKPAFGTTSEAYKQHAIDTDVASQRQERDMLALQSKADFLKEELKTLEGKKDADSVRRRNEMESYLPGLERDILQDKKSIAARQQQRAKMAEDEFKYDKATNLVGPWG